MRTLCFLIHELAMHSDGTAFKIYFSTVDRLEGELMGELENARLVRLLCKFGFINERPECGIVIRI